jgi:hypothetical protein
MRILFLFIFLLGSLAITPASAQNKKENGKTYHDTAGSNLKEVFHYREVYKVAQNPNDPDDFRDTTYIVKHGDYACYNAAGKLLKSGYYSDNKQDGTWTYYNESGDIIRTEVYERGRLVKQPKQ